MSQELECIDCGAATDVPPDADGLFTDGTRITCGCGHVNVLVVDEDGVRFAEEAW
jgi:hypothetical protein